MDIRSLLDKILDVLFKIVMAIGIADAFIVKTKNKPGIYIHQLWLRPTHPAKSEYDHPIQRVDAVI